MILNLIVKLDDREVLGFVDLFCYILYLCYFIDYVNVFN